MSALFTVQFGSKNSFVGHIFNCNKETGVAQVNDMWGQIFGCVKTSNT